MKNSRDVALHFPVRFCMHGVEMGHSSWDVFCCIGCGWRAFLLLGEETKNL